MRLYFGRWLPTRRGPSSLRHFSSHAVALHGAFGVGDMLALPCCLLLLIIRLGGIFSSS